MIYVLKVCLIILMFELFDFSNYGYIGLFLSSFLAATLLPFGSEALVVLLIINKFEPVSVVIVATFGNFFGALTTYYIGLIGRRDIIQKYFSISNKKLIKAENGFKKYGKFLLLFTWVPIIGDAITAMGGLMKLDLKIFSFFVFIGKLLRYAFIAYITLKI